MVTSVLYDVVETYEDNIETWELCCVFVVSFENMVSFVGIYVHVVAVELNTFQLEENVNLDTMEYEIEEFQSKFTALIGRV